jgi:hypothetical protein
MPTTTEALEALELTVAEAVETVYSAQTSLVAAQQTTESLIEAAVQTSENAALNPLYVLTESQLRTQALFINYINN